MKIYTLIAASLCLFVFNSCKKDDPTNPTQPSYPNYGQLKAGNYWVYQVFELDSSGFDRPTNDFDSCFIAKDTVLNGKTYYEMHRPGLNGMKITYLRDSLSYIVDYYGNILFSSSDFSTTFATAFHIEAGNDTVYKSTRTMTDKDYTVATDAGTFVTSAYLVKNEIWPNWVAHYRTFYIKTRYAKNVGIVTETLPPFLSSQQFFERRLVRYHVQQ